MKKWNALLIIVMALIPFAVKAQDAKRFVAAEIQCNFHETHTKQTRLIPHINLVAGHKVTDNFGLELGGYYSAQVKNNGYWIRKNGIHLSGLVFVPFNDRVSLKLGVGGSQFMPVLKERDKTPIQYSMLVPRFLGGIEVSLTEEIAFRAHLIWENASLLKKSHKAFKNDNIHLNLGLGYKF